MDVHCVVRPSEFIDLSAFTASVMQKLQPSFFIPGPSEQVLFRAAMEHLGVHLPRTLTPSVAAGYLPDTSLEGKAGRGRCLVLRAGTYIRR